MKKHVDVRFLVRDDRIAAVLCIAEEKYASEFLSQCISAVRTICSSQNNEHINSMVLEQFIAAKTTASVKSFIPEQCMFEITFANMSYQFTAVALI